MILAEIYANIMMQHQNIEDCKIMYLENIAPYVIWN
jgi:hypothetical protein